MLPSQGIVSNNLTLADDPAGTSIPVLDRAPKSTVRAQVAERLRSAISTGDIPTGAPLVEASLSERLDVSRGTLRTELADHMQRRARQTGQLLRPFPNSPHDPRHGGRA